MSDSYGLIDPTLAVSPRNTEAHPNPYYNYSQIYSPKRLKELFKWCEYLFYNSAHIYSALRKVGEYPITEVTYETTNKSLKEKHKNLLERIIRARELLIKATLDKYVYGNAFISMYQPFIRYLKCPKCQTLSNIQNVNYKFNIRRISFSYTCAACNADVTTGKDGVVDRKLMLSRKVNFIRWDPKLMDIDHNPMTGDSVYYWTIPQDIMQRVNSGHKTLIDTLPIGVLEAIKEGKKFKFAPEAIFHMKIGGPAGISPQWGLPPLISTLQLFHYTAILRKANEAIALDHMVPYRILHPAQASGNADPVVQISLAKWKDEMSTHLKQFRRDPLHIMYAPIPIGMVQLGGQGRALLTLGEVQEAEKNIVAALGIPIEFLYGGLTNSGMEATLRLIENQLETHVNDLLDLLQWADDKCAQFLGWEKIEVGMTKFRMVDDHDKQNSIMQIWLQGKQGGAQIISDQTIAQMFDIDLKQEEDNIKQEQLDAVRMQQKMQIEIRKLQDNMATRIQMEAQQSSGQSYNPQVILAQADQLVQELMNYDEGMKKSRLHQLQVEDIVMYAVVIQRLEQQQTTSQQQARSQMRQGAA
jgi:hypothetical protein